MRIGIFSDIHSNAQALEAVLRELRGKVDAYLCAGDLTGYYARPNDVFELLETVGADWIAGNHERFLTLNNLENLSPVVRRSVEYTRRVLYPSVKAKLVEAPTERRLELNGSRVAVFHGSPWDSVNEYVYPDYNDWEKFNVPMIRRIHKRLVINPGSCGQPRDGDPRAAYAILDTRTGEAELRRVAYDWERVCEEIEALGFDPILQKVLRKGSTHD
jgi:predicted phosphodiesterase